MEKDLIAKRAEILSLEKTFKQACDSAKPFYEKKEILKKLKLARHELQDIEKNKVDVSPPNE